MPNSVITTSIWCRGVLTTLPAGNWGSTRTLAAMLYNASQPAAAQYPQTDEPLTLLTPKHQLTTTSGMTVLRAHWTGGVKGAATNTYDIERPAFWATTE